MSKKVEIEQASNGFVVVIQPGNSLSEDKKIANDMDDLIQVLRDYFKDPFKELKNA